MHVLIDVRQSVLWQGRRHQRRDRLGRADCGPRHHRRTRRARYRVPAECERCPNIVKSEVKAAIDADKLQFEAEKTISHGRAMFHKVYHSDTLQLSTMKDLWKGKKPPTPLTFEHAASVDSSANNNAEYIIADQRVWSVRECAEKFVDV